MAYIPSLFCAGGLENGALMYAIGFKNGLVGPTVLHKVSENWFLSAGRFSSLACTGVYEPAGREHQCAL